MVGKKHGCKVSKEKGPFCRKIKEKWNIIGKDYNCAHLNFEGVFNGCIHNYTMADYCSKPFFK